MIQSPRSTYCVFPTLPYNGSTCPIFSSFGKSDCCVHSLLAFRLAGHAHRLLPKMQALPQFSGGTADKTTRIRDRSVSKSAKGVGKRAGRKMKIVHMQNQVFNRGFSLAENENILKQESVHFRWDFHWVVFGRD